MSYPKEFKFDPNQRSTPWHSAEMGELRSFDPSVFIKDSKEEQSLAGFVLALALMQNDFKDLVVAEDCLTKVIPSDRKTISPAMGEYNGMQFHIIRQYLALLFALIERIEKSADVIEGKPFKKILGRMHPTTKRHWEAIVDVAFKRQTHEKPYQYLAQIRNKVSFHYDPGRMEAGYRAWTKEEKPEILKNPYYSVGVEGMGIRFYFADAAAQTYVYSLGPQFLKQSPREFLKKLVRDMLASITGIVLLYININSPAKGNGC